MSDRTLGILGIGLGAVGTGVQLVFPSVYVGLVFIAIGVIVVVYALAHDRIQKGAALSGGQERVILFRRLMPWLRPKPRMAMLEAMQAQDRGIDMLSRAVAQRTKSRTEVHRKYLTWQTNTQRANKAMTPANKDKLVGKVLAEANAIWSKAADDIEASVDKTNEGAGLLRSALQTKMYWHRKRQTGQELTTPAVKATFTQLQELVQSEIADLKKTTNFEPLEGRSGALDATMARYKRAIQHQAKANEKVLEICRSVLKFHRKHAS